MQLQLTICCRYDVNQSNIRYSDVKQSVSRDHTIKDAKSSEPEYEAITTDYKPDCDVKMDANPAYQATSQSYKKSSYRNKTETTIATAHVSFSM